MAKVLGFLPWPPASSPAFLSSPESPGTHHHGPVTPAKRLTACAAILLVQTIKTKSQHHPSGSPTFPEESSQDVPLSCLSLRKSLGWAEKDTEPHHTWPGSKVSNVYCTLGILRPPGNLLSNQSPPFSEVLGFLGARPPPLG